MILKRNVLALALASGLCLTAGIQAAPADAATKADGSMAGSGATGDQAAATSAQQAGPGTGKDDKSKQTQDQQLAKSLSAITVTGYNQDMEKSIDYQRYSDTITNVITSADIGGLPDQSIADALTRLPGVSAERIAGQASQVNIRGLSGNFIQTTLNGREQPSTSGSNYIQFDQYPSELINMATVYKSSQASLITGGVGGTIALQTANPLEAPKEQNLNVDARGSYNSQAGDVAGANSTGYRLSAAYQGKFLDNTLGVGLGVAQMYQPHVAEQFVGEASDGQLYTLPSGQKAYLTQGLQLQQNGGTERRTGEVATVVWKPTDELQVSGDAFYSKFKNTSFGYGFRTQNIYGGNQGLISNAVLGPFGTMTGGTVTSTGGGNFSNETTADNYTTDTSVFSGGLNARWDHGNWHVNTDLSLSRASSNEINVDTTADPYNGLGTATPTLMGQSTTYQLAGRKIGTVSFANPGIYTNLNDMGLSRYGVYPYIYHDKMKAFRTDVKYDMPNSSWLAALEAGVYLNNHDYNADREVYVYGNEWGGPGTTPLTIPASAAKVTCWSGKFANFPCFLQLNGPAILAAHGIVANPVKDIHNNSWSEIQSGSVAEQTRDLYFQGDLDAQVFGHQLTGNFGMRYSHQNQTSNGLQQVGNNAGIPITDGNGYTSLDYAPLTVGKKYSDWLPSLNLVYHVSDDDQARFSAAKVLSRPPINQMMAGSGSWVSTAGGQNYYNVWGGTSPLLDPLRATQYDLTFEHYFDDSTGLLSAGVYYKDIKSFIQAVTYNNFDFAGAGITVPIDPATGKPFLNGDYQTAYNAKGGQVKGLELAASKTGFLPGIWKGLGVQANFALTDSNVRNPTTLGGPTSYIGLPGLSKRVASAAVFYDYGPFSARVSGNYRSKFASDTQMSVTNQMVTFAAETVYDFQASYDITQQWGVVFQLLNLTNQPTRTYFGSDPSQTGTIQYFGRTSYLGVNFKL
ncbi:TonB-dependent receptor [Dyella soli]|uniref:TonB-dependent receptor n=1 Tax=Dyella soli TaxID=522319 RepID=A0A4V2NKX8_9GAMM|nr:TonB-dependent receptor [Dyella soli]TCI06542.1 TonB-dependent receptor [Dyella soli]